MPNLNPRNGLKWRGGRPRWEPSPASRALGIAGRDLKDLDGRWISERGIAVMLCDARHLWAKSLRQATGTGAEAQDARHRLGLALDALPAVTDDLSRLKRDNVADLIEKARALLEARPERPVGTGGRTVDDMIEGYFAQPPRSTKPSTVQAYRAQARKISAKFGTEPITAVSRGAIYNWYHDDLRKAHGIATCNLAVGAFAAFFAWASRQDPPWLPTGFASPATRLDLDSAPGRLVFFPLDLERAFVAWCDSHDFADVGDAVTLGCWTGARQVDMCGASLGDLAGTTWRFVPVKTERKGLEALPGILDNVRRRVDRRRTAARYDGVTYLSAEAAPFLWHPVLHRRHTSQTIGARFREAAFLCAREAVATDDKLLAGIAGMHLQDTRDTCVTRLYHAGIPLDRIPPWTGHSQSSAETILRHHYLKLLDEGAVATAQELARWATGQNFEL